MKELFKIYFEEEIPKYIQIAGHIKKLIDYRYIKDGEKLPTIRELCDFLNVNNIGVDESIQLKNTFSSTNGLIQ